MRPFIKMIASDFVGMVDVEDIVIGDILPNGVVTDTDTVDGECLIEVGGALFDTYAKGAEVMRIGRLTKVAWEDIVKPHMEAGNQ